MGYSIIRKLYTVFLLRRGEGGHILFQSRMLSNVGNGWEVISVVL